MYILIFLLYYIVQERSRCHIWLMSLEQHSSNGYMGCCGKISSNAAWAALVLLHNQFHKLHKPKSHESLIHFFILELGTYMSSIWQKTYISDSSIHHYQLQELLIMVMLLVEPLLHPHRCLVIAIIFIMDTDGVITSSQQMQKSLAGFLLLTITIAEIYIKRKAKPLLRTKYIICMMKEVIYEKLHGSQIINGTK